MKVKIYISLLKALLLVPILIFVSCEQNQQEIVQNPATVFNKNSEMVSLLKTAIDDSSGEQCLEIKYPMIFYVYIYNSQSISTKIINNDDALLAFFIQLQDTDQISIDFPLQLIGADTELIDINNLEDLKATLTLAIDACQGSTQYEYCHPNNKKVYVCHNGNTLCISVNAIQTHLDHGDELGSCDD